MIRLANDTISRIDIRSLINWLETYPRLTMGEQTKEFEEAWADWLGVKHAVFVNSGSSANLLMIYALKYKYGVNKIAIPALSWATDLAPLMQFGIEPVLIDCNMTNLGLDLDHLEDELKSDPGIGAVLSVSVLGLVPDTTRLLKICNKYDAHLIEDNCEAMGSAHGQNKLGTFGKMSSNSLFFGHHISTIEGGLISTDDKELYDLLKMLRSHGWSRDVDIRTRAELESYWRVDEFSNAYTFYVPGFNLRSTDLQAFIGLMQLERLGDIARSRFDNFKAYADIIKRGGLWTPEWSWFDLVSNHAYPIISKEKEWNVKRLKESGIESRPLIAGSLGNQPFYKKEYGKKFLPNADEVDRYGYYVPNHPDLTITDINRVCRLILNYS